MDEQIKKMQSMWLEKKTNSHNIEELIKRLSKIEKKIKFRSTFLMIILVFLIMVSVILYTEIVAGIYYTLAYLFLFAAIIIKLISLYKMNKIISHESDYTNLSFIKRIKNQQAFKTTHILIYLFLAILALNFALLGLFYEKESVFGFPLTSKNRIFYHLSTIVLFILGYLKHKKFMTAIKKETSNLITELENEN